MSHPRVSIFGLGYVGSVTAACLAERGCSVIGCDVAANKVEQINAGKAPIGEPGLEELLLAQKNSGRLRATTYAAEAVGESDISLICVGTPSTASGDLDLQFVENVAQEIAEAISGLTRRHTVIFRSTMLPGSTRRMAERFFGALSDRVDIFFYPEFLRQGSALADFRDPSLSAIGVLNEGADLNSVEKVLESTTGMMTVESAELLKYACNAFHATKVAFANEIGRIGKSVGIDSTEVMSTLCEDTRLNISTYYMRPGTPFGGSCLPKDVSALCQLAQGIDVSVPLLSSLMESNQCHLDSVLARVEAAGSNEVILMGLAFKDGTDDLRGSAMLELAAILLRKRFAVQIYDPAVSPETLIGANKRFAEENLPRFDSLLTADIAGAFKGAAKTIVISKACIPLEQLGSYLSDGETHHVIDVNGWEGLCDIAPSYEGVCW